MNIKDMEFSEDQLDLLAETANLAMGKAGADLAKVLDEFVELQVPKIQMVSATDVVNSIQPLSSCPSSTSKVSIVRMGFENYLTGEALVIFGEDSIISISDIMGEQPEPDIHRERELLLDISNIIVGACLYEIGEELQGEINVARPSIFCHNMDSTRVMVAIFSREKIGWLKTLLMKITFSLEDRKFVCDLLIFLSEPSIKKLLQKLDEMIENS